MSRCVAIGERGWMRLGLATAAACPNISMPRFVENSIGSNCFSSRSGLWRPSGTRCSRGTTKASTPPPMLLGVHGVGPEFASVLWSKGLSRRFENRRQVAAFAALPDALAKRVGQSRAGHLAIGQPATRTMTIQLAWLWLRHQPRSALTLWFKDRMDVMAVVGGRRRSWRSAKAVGCALEICERWGRDRRRHG